jgi:hypothetical protein
MMWLFRLLNSFGDAFEASQNAMPIRKISAISEKISHFHVRSQSCRIFTI